MPHTCLSESDPGDRIFGPPLKPRIRTPATNLVASRLGSWTEFHSPRGIDAASHHCVACRKRNVTIDRCPPIKSREICTSLKFPRPFRGAEIRNERCKIKERY